MPLEVVRGLTGLLACRFMEVFLRFESVWRGLRFGAASPPPEDLEHGIIKDIAVSSGGPVAAAFRENDVNAEQQRGEVKDHKTPDRERLPIKNIGPVWTRGAPALALDEALLRIRR